jgi:F-type H+-transporting ATPase subunit b
MKKNLSYQKQVFNYLRFFLLLSLCLAGTAIASSPEHGGGKHWLDTDWYRVMNFSVLIGALFFLLRKPVSQALNGRIEGIKTELEELEAKKKEAEKKLVKYNEQIAALEKEAEKIMVEYKRQGEAARDRIIEVSKMAAAKLEEQAKRTIENEFKNAKAKLQEEIIEITLTRAEKLVKDKITSDDQNRLVDEYLNKVVA